MKLINWLSPLVISSLVLTGCVSARSTLQPTRVVQTPLSTIPTTTAMTIPALTLTPTIANTETPVPTATATPSPTPTMTPVATLGAEQAKVTIAAFLQDGGNCAVPCFVGIIPEKSTLNEAKEILNHLGLQIKKITNQGRDFYDTNYGFENGLSFSGHLAIQDELIKNIKIGINLDSTRAEYQRDWLGFSPETLINLYGQPSRVRFATDWGPRSYLEMNIYFDSIDLIVQYIGFDLISKEKGHRKFVRCQCHLTMLGFGWAKSQNIHRLTLFHWKRQLR